MGYDGTGWKVTSTTDRIVQIRAAWNAALIRQGRAPLVFDDTIEAAEIETYAAVANSVESMGSLLYDAQDPDAAFGVHIDRIFDDRPARKAPTKSRYTVQVKSTSGSNTYPSGFLIRDPLVKGIDWRVVDDVTFTTAWTDMIVECTTVGPNAFDSGGVTVLKPTTPIANVAAIQYDPDEGDAFTVGIAREQDPSYRVRGKRLKRTEPGPTRAGVKQALLAIPWMVAVDPKRSAPSTVTCTVHPAPIGSDQRILLATTIYKNLALGIITDGGDSETITVEDGSSVEVFWSVGSTVIVPIVYVLVMDPAILFSQTEMRVAILAAVDAEFARLEVGEVLYYARVFVALASIAGVVRVSSLTIDGATADITPDPADILIGGATTGTVS